MLFVCRPDVLRKKNYRMYKRSTRKNAQPGYAAYKRFGGYAAKWAADRIGSWAKGRLAARAAQKDKARKRSKTSTKTPS